MARKILNRKELREENDAAEAAEAAAGTEGAVAKPAKKAAAKKPTARKSRAKTPKEIRLKAFWDVMNQSMKRITRFEYHERKQALKRAEELTATQKTPHFVQLTKDDIAE